MDFQQLIDQEQEKVDFDDSSRVFNTVSDPVRVVETSEYHMVFQQRGNTYKVVIYPYTQEVTDIAGRVINSYEANDLEVYLSGLNKDPVQWTKVWTQTGVADTDIIRTIREYFHARY